MDALERFAVIGDEPFDRQIDFADQHAIVKFIDDPAQSGDDLMYFGLIRRIGLGSLSMSGPSPVQVGLGGLSRNAASLTRCEITSTRNPSTPRRSQNRSTSCIAARTCGLRQLKSGCSARRSADNIVAFAHPTSRRRRRNG